MEALYRYTNPNILLGASSTGRYKACPQGFRGCYNRWYEHARVAMATSVYMCVTKSLKARARTVDEDSRALLASVCRRCRSSESSITDADRLPPARRCKTVDSGNYKSMRQTLIFAISCHTRRKSFSCEHQIVCTPMWYI